MANGRWTEVLDGSALNDALKLAKGSYQRDLLMGAENLSGSTLRGKAASYGAVYKRSRKNLLSRIEKAGIPVSERIGNHGARILVLGQQADQMALAA